MLQEGARDMTVAQFNDNNIITTLHTYLLLCVNLRVKTVFNHNYVHILHIHTYIHIYIQMY